jgi:hypothetical protein
MNSLSFVTFCLNYETNLVRNTSKNSGSIIDFKKSIINLPRLSSLENRLSVIILSDGSTFYLPCSIYSNSRKFNNNASIIKFLSSKSDLYSSLFS